MDDYSSSRVNAALSACETIDPADVLTASYMLIATFLAGFVSELANMKDLLQGQNSVVMP